MHVSQLKKSPQELFQQSLDLQVIDRFDEAEFIIREALATLPNAPELWNNLGNALKEKGAWTEAKNAYARALALRPDYPEARTNDAYLKLLLGEWDEAWPDLEWRWKCASYPKARFPRPLWDGSNARGARVLLCPEQGFGDAIQFVRYAPLVKERGATVMLRCRPELAKLFHKVTGVDRLIVAGEALPDFDFQIPFLSLPGAFRTTPHSVPSWIPYLRGDFPLPPALVHELKGNEFKIGICWSGNPQHADAKKRAAPLRHFSRLAQYGTRLLSLQRDTGLEEMRRCAGEFPLRSLGEHFRDFADTAATIARLDLVVTVDTSIAHLTGALGKPVWLLLPSVPDWRWMLERSDTPWYPTMRIFRQERPGEWDGVFENVARALDNHLGASRISTRPSS